MIQDTKQVKNPGKQRKIFFNAPAHLRHKLMSAPLSKELSASKGAKSLPVRKGDTILIKRGDNKGFEGKVSRVDLKAYRIYIEGLTREKVDGTNIFLPIHPSKVEIRNLNLDDKWRKNILSRKKELLKLDRAEKPKIKPTKKDEKVALKEDKAEDKELEVVPVEEKAVSKPAEEQVARESPKPKEPKAKKTTPKKRVAKKSSDKKETESTALQETPMLTRKEKTAIIKKTKKPEAKIKRASTAKKTDKKETTSKPRAKTKVSEKTRGEK